MSSKAAAAAAAATRHKVRHKTLIKFKSYARLLLHTRRPSLQNSYYHSSSVQSGSFELEAMVFKSEALA